MHSRLLKKEIIYNIHATHRFTERQILPEEIIGIIDDKKTVVSIQKNKRIRFENKNVVVIGEIKNDSIWIITAFRK
jgi:hypothetical protein